MNSNSAAPQKKPQAKQKPGMRFQERDDQILKAIQYYGDGVLSRNQLYSLLFADVTDRAMEKRLQTLQQNGYIDWPTPEQRRNHPIPKRDKGGIIWLGWKGALYVAGQEGIAVDAPQTPNENQLRQFQHALRKAGFRWVREPGWGKLAHTLDVTDFLLAVERAVKELPGFVLEDVIQESVFRMMKDVIEVPVKGSNRQGRRVKQEVLPDLFISIVDTKRQVQGEPVRARLLLENDRATHSNPKWGESKAMPYALYIKSDVYKKRFGHNSGRWLVVTTEEVRMKNLMVQTRQDAGPAAKAFWFTTMPLVDRCQNVLTAPIWLRADWKKPGPLFQLKDRT